MTDQLTHMENESIKGFLKQAASEGYFSGRVLDYGCGKQPYRSIVKAGGGAYHGFDRADHPMNQFGDVGGWNLEQEGPLDEDWDAILCNQVVQYVPIFFRDDDGEGLPVLLHQFYLALRGGGHLVMTYPTNWPEVQEADLWRFTKAGMERLLVEAGFSIVLHQRRALMHAMIEGPRASPERIELPVGYGVVCRA